MRLIKISIALCLMCGLAACAVTGPADDGSELSQESVDIGRLLGDDLLTFRPKPTLNPSEDDNSTAQ